MRAVHRRVATGRTDSALTSARGPSGCLRSCHRAHRLWAGRHASVPLCFCSSFSSAQTTPCHLSAGCSGPEGLFRTPFRFRLFEVRSAFCPRSLLVSLSHRRKGRFGGNQAQSNHRPSLGSRKSTRSDSFSLFSYKPLLRRCLQFLSWSGLVYRNRNSYAACPCICFPTDRAWRLCVLSVTRWTGLLTGLCVYSVPSLNMAHMIPESRLASATTAIRFPRRCAMPSAHLHSASVCGFFTLIMVCAACTSSDLAREAPALVM